MICCSDLSSDWCHRSTLKFRKFLSSHITQSRANGPDAASTFSFLFSCFLSLLTFWEFFCFLFCFRWLMFLPVQSWTSSSLSIFSPDFCGMLPATNLIRSPVLSHFWILAGHRKHILQCKFYFCGQSAPMNVITRAINISTHGENCAKKIYSVIPGRKTHFRRANFAVDHK